MFTLKTIEGDEFYVQNLAGILNLFPENFFSNEDNITISVPFCSKFTEHVSDYLNTDNFERIGALSYMEQLHFLKVSYYFNLSDDFMQKLANIISSKITYNHIPESYKEDIYEISKFFHIKKRLSLMYNCAVYLEDIKGIVLNFSLYPSPYIETVWKRGGFIRYDIFNNDDVNNLFTIHHENKYKFKRIIINGYNNKEIIIKGFLPLNEISLRNCRKSVHKLLYSMIKENTSTLKRLTLCCGKFDLRKCNQLQEVSININNFISIENEKFSIKHDSEKSASKCQHSRILKLPCQCKNIELTFHDEFPDRTRNNLKINVLEGILNLNVREYPFQIQSDVYELSFFAHLAGPIFFQLNNILSDVVVNLKYLNLTAYYRWKQNNMNFDVFTQNIHQIAPNVEILALGYNTFNNKENLKNLSNMMRLKFLRLLSKSTIDDDSLYHVIKESKSLKLLYICAVNIPNKTATLANELCHLDSSSLISCCFQQYVQCLTNTVQIIGAKSANGNWLDCLSDWQHLLQINYRFIHKYMNSFQSKFIKINIIHNDHYKLFSEMNLCFNIRQFFEIEINNDEVTLELRSNYFQASRNIQLIF